MENKYYTPKLDNDEVWKEIRGYEGIYEISNKGVVRRMSYNLSKGVTYDGYPLVILTRAGKRSTKTIHRLVAEAFIDNPENKPAVNHKDGVKSNNALDNLEWATYSENTLHALRTGLKDKSWQDGEKNCSSKLTVEQVLDIREKCKTMKVAKVHRDFYPEMHYNTIYGIKIRRLWKTI